MLRRRTHADTPAFADFVDVQEIARGGFATVYRAREIETDRPVALKVLDVSEVLPHVVDMFHREARALGALSTHPNIVTLYRTTRIPDGRPMLVLELCSHSMTSRLRTSGPIHAAEAMATAVKIAGALETAHRGGVLHRDIKPQNILVTGYGEPALADFGVALLQGSGAETSAAIGFTTLHAAPELLEGNPASPATDVYELASTTYQLVSGRAAFNSFEGEAPAAVILRILRDPVAPLLIEGVPTALSDLLVASMAKDPASRPRTALEFAEALRSIEAARGWPVTPCAVLGAQARPVEISSAAPGVPVVPPPAPHLPRPPLPAVPADSSLAVPVSARSDWVRPVDQDARPPGPAAPHGWGVPPDPAAPSGPRPPSIVIPDARPRHVVADTGNPTPAKLDARSGARPPIGPPAAVERAPTEHLAESPTDAPSPPAPTDAPALPAPPAPALSAPPAPAFAPPPAAPSMAFAPVNPVMGRPPVAPSTAPFGGPRPIESDPVLERTIVPPGLATTRVAPPIAARASSPRRLPMSVLVSVTAVIALVILLIALAQLT